MVLLVRNKQADKMLFLLKKKSPFFLFEPNGAAFGKTLPGKTLLLFFFFSLLEKKKHSKGRSGSSKKPILTQLVKKKEGRFFSSFFSKDRKAFLINN